MDELDLLKSHWQKEDAKETQLSSKQIYPMLLKKSSSIVKTLFYISIAELVFWIALNFLPLCSADYSQKMQTTFGNGYVFWILTTFSFSIILIFIYLLFKSYKKISVTDSTKELMKSILKTRKIIKYYVIYNLAVIVISFPTMLYLTLIHDPKLTNTISEFSSGQMAAFIGFILLVTLVFVIVIWLFYKLLYGILLKRLNRNYKELKKLEV